MQIPPCPKCSRDPNATGEVIIDSYQTIHGKRDYTRCGVCGEAGPDEAVKEDIPAA